MVGLDFGTALSVLNSIAHACRTGAAVAHPQTLATLLGHPQVFLQLRPVDPTWHTTSLFNVAREYFGSVPQAVQVVMADKEGRFPWDAGHSLGVRQPSLWEPYPGGWPDENTQ
ncbi:DUF4262 domain-containing protein (plasmid) [Streptosporangium sp. NBC_01495]|uniref:DUF4262 domain-containing protein n=1 Tax=Streptosporangium sp. NBC_01495 TaxID=2903899 RepID=UPI002E35DFDC|nr:DUF4262 domain-containing protein [Streptosporangium sp. NBC_01495]